MTVDEFKELCVAAGMPEGNVALVDRVPDDLEDGTLYNFFLSPTGRNPQFGLDQECIFSIIRDLLEIKSWSGKVNVAMVRSLNQLGCRTVLDYVRDQMSNNQSFVEAYAQIRVESGLVTATDVTAHSNALVSFLSSIELNLGWELDKRWFRPVYWLMLFVSGSIGYWMWFS